MLELDYPNCVHKQRIDQCPEQHDYGYEAQRFAEQHIMDCHNALYDETDGPEIAPFCGCTTCEVREILAAGWRIFELDRKQSEPGERLSE